MPRDVDLFSINNWYEFAPAVYFDRGELLIVALRRIDWCYQIRAALLIFYSRPVPTIAISIYLSCGFLPRSDSRNNDDLLLLLLLLLCRSKPTYCFVAVGLLFCRGTDRPTALLRYRLTTHWYCFLVVAIGLSPCMHFDRACTVTVYFYLSG